MIMEEMRMENQEIAELKAQLKQAQDDAELMANAYHQSLLHGRIYIDLMLYVLPLLDRSQSGQRLTAEELSRLFMEVENVESNTIIFCLPRSFEEAASGTDDYNSANGFIEWDDPEATPDHFTNQAWMPLWSAFLRNVSVDSGHNPIPKDEIVRRLPE